MLQGALNFRDLGGLRTDDGRCTRPGRVFRSNSLQELTAADVATVVEGLGLRTVIDLRDAEEVSRDGRGPLERHGLRWVEASLRPTDQSPGRPGQHFTTLADRYWTYLDAAPQIVRALEALAVDSALPAVFHCSAGKDRTGVLAAVLLRCLGVPSEQVVADYAANAYERDELVAFLRRRPSYAATVDHFHPGLLGCEPGTMAEFLARLESEHGGARRWAVQAGLRPAALARLKAALLQP